MRKGRRNSVIDLEERGGRKRRRSGERSAECGPHSSIEAQSQLTVGGRRGGEGGQARLQKENEEDALVYEQRRDLSQWNIQGDPYGRGIVYVDSKFEVAFNCKVGLLPRPVTEL